ncbi:1-acyl-sn-glycerol-3-phosphate acyltransferase [Alloscardovia macacae]|uniref:lysophospholipid acyltransferase family protein n=1 Tax=Alloscardovia macacae TaxID=1160091 RepID=UPI000A2DE43D|nr:lysophospholipid acyltransferase family protein [Alloscardovia macacae]OTA26463.1 1-acyl-sn-glycerol-3-phosphate acyltransferase [Alloscardovia macacae]
MVSRGKPSPGKSVPALSTVQVEKLARAHHLSNPLEYLPTGTPRANNEAEINAQNPAKTKKLLDMISWVAKTRMKALSWGLENVPETGVFITAATHVTQFDVFVPMTGLFHQGRRPRYMAKAELGTWPIIGDWFKAVGMQPVPRRSGKASDIIHESVRILVEDGRPLTIWPEGTVTRDPLKWPMSLKPGMAIIALEASRALGRQVPLYVSVTWGAASINHFFPWPRKNVVMAYDMALDYSDLLEGSESWEEYGAPSEAVDELTERVALRMEELMEEIRGEKRPEEGRWDFRTMRRTPRGVKAGATSTETTAVDTAQTSEKGE